MDDMSTQPLLIPQAFWFRLAFPCLRIDGLPRSGVRGRLLDLPASCALPAITRLEDREPWAEIRTAWNPGGLAVAIQVSGKVGPIRRDPSEPDFVDGVNIW